MCIPVIWLVRSASKLLEHSSSILLAEIESLFQIITQLENKFCSLKILDFIKYFSFYSGISPKCSFSTEVF